MYIEIFRLDPIAKGDPWYWHFINKGRITADAEAFPTKAHAVRAAKAVVMAVAEELITAIPPKFKTTKIDDRMTHITWR